MILEHLDKNNLHHAYLIEGSRDEVVPEILVFLKEIGVNTMANNPDFVHVALDSFKVDDARNFKSLGSLKGFSSKKIFIISANQILLEAQNSLLKMFEEPIENTHFFIVVPDSSALIKTFVSRFYLINTRGELKKEIIEAEKFIKMPIRTRLEYLKELLAKEDEDGDDDVLPTDSNRSKALLFLNALEKVLHRKVSRVTLDIIDMDFFEQIFNVRKFLRMPGSSTKSLMESIALVIPNFEN